MTRLRTTLIAGLAVVALGVLAPGAVAQDSTSTTLDYPGTSAAPAPPPCRVTVTASALLRPRASLNLIGTCIQLTNGRLVRGTFHSTPIDLPQVTVVGNSATFPVTLPDDFDVKAFHTLTITDVATGRLLLNGQIYVDSAGNITAPPATTPLPRTGASHTDDLMKVAVVLLAAGATATLVAKRRRVLVPTT